MTPARSAAYVATVKAELIARGVIPVPQTTNCHAFLITNAVAWGLRGQGARLLLKSSGNVCDWQGVSYSIDAIVFDDGWVDALASGGPPANMNGPSWQWHPAGPPNPDTVVAPFDPDQSAPGGTDPDVPPFGVPEALVVELLGKLLVEMQQVRREVAELRAQQAKGVSITLKPVQ